jgi:anti-sigma B factor antagonist
MFASPGIPLTDRWRLSDEPLDGTGHLVAAEGELDLYTAPALRARLDRLIADGARDLILDLTGATFVDSSALAVLVGSVRRLRSSGGRLLVVTRAPMLRRTLGVTRLDQIMDVFDARERALAAVRSMPRPRETGQPGEYSL